MRTRLAVLAVALVALTAGCAGSLSTGESDAGVGPETINESLMDVHEDTLADDGSFTIRATVTGGDGTTEYRAKVAGGGSRANVTTNGDKVIEEYLNESTRHRRTTGDDGGALYQVTDREFGLSPLLMPMLYPLDAKYERVNTTTIDGARVGVYEAVGLGEDGHAFDGEVTDFDEQNFSATLYVTDDGMIKRAEWSMETRGQTVEATLTVGSVGDTTVSRPQWADRAVAANQKPQQPPTPEAVFDVEYNMPDERVVMTHSRGDIMSGDRLTVEVSTNETTRTVPVNASKIEAGSEITVENVPPGATVRLLWSGGDRTEVIYRYEAPTEQESN